MYLQDCVITFSGQQPTQFSINLIEKMLSKLQGGTPSDSVMTLSVTTNDVGVKGILKVVSVSGVFESKFAGPEIIDVVHRLKTEMKTHISKWALARNLR